MLALSICAGCRPSSATITPPVAMTTTATNQVTPPIAGAAQSPITIERIAAFPPPGWQVPRMVRMSPDGALITYLRSESHGAKMALFAFDTHTREHRVLLRASDLAATDKPLSREEELRRERQRMHIQGITSYAWASRAPVLMVPFGDRVLLRTAAGEIKEVTSEQAIDPKLCADGSKIAFARGRELWIAEVGGQAKALTKDAPEGVTRGQSDFNMQEEFAEPSGIWWSPACDRLAYLEVDERHVGEVPILGFRGRADLQMLRYPRTGGKNPTVRLGIIDLAGKTTWVEMPAASGYHASDQYIGRLSWSPDGSALFLQRLSRDQQRLMLVRVDTKTGKSRALIEHTDSSWEMLTEVRAIDDARLLVIWPHEGHAHLRVIDASTGAVMTELTRGDWDVFRVVGLDRAHAWFIANKGATLDRRLFAVELASGKISEISGDPGVHDIEGDHPEHGWVDIHSANDRLPQADIRGADGTKLGSIEVPREPEFDKLDLRAAELVTIPSKDGEPELHGALLEPRDKKPGVRYPTIVMVYGGPGVQTVLNEYNPRVLWQHLADRGFRVFQVDNRGSVGRGHGFDAPVHKRLGEIELRDQLRALDWLTARPDVDPGRVGIYGHSYGGYMTLMAMLRAPGRYKVGVSGSPVTDWRYYDTGYTERYMGTPEGNLSGYDASALAPLAKNLKGRLLVIHALMDENVHFEHTATLIDALVAADKDFDLLVFPGERHGYRSPAARRYAYRRVIDYFVQNL
jgi:dipeptidyl-peptidase-4